MTVEVNLDNYKDYLPVPTEPDNYDGAIKPCIEYLLKSNVYADGWIYKEVSSDFKVEYVVPSGEIQNMMFDLTEIGTYFMPDDPELQILDVKGKVRFEHIGAVQSYEMDEFYKSKRSSTEPNTVSILNPFVKSGFLFFLTLCA